MKSKSPTNFSGYTSALSLALPSLCVCVCVYRRQKRQGLSYPVISRQVGNWNWTRSSRDPGAGLVGDCAPRFLVLKLRLSSSS
jgi:hypothetical protein